VKIFTRNAHFLAGYKQSAHIRIKKYIGKIFSVPCNVIVLFW